MSEQPFPIGASGSTDAKTVDQAPASGAERPAADGETAKTRLPWIWIPVVICLGLLVAAGYVGARILASRPVARPVQVVIPAAPKQIAAIPAAENPVAQTPLETTTMAPVTAEDQPPQIVSSSRGPSSNPGSSNVVSSNPVPVHSPWQPASPASEDWGLITPQPGERYIQISALNTTAARRYIEQLRRGPLEPHLAPGPTPTIVRVLIGPFHDTDSLLNTRADLKAAGIDCFIRDY